MNSFNKTVALLGAVMMIGVLFTPTSNAAVVEGTFEKNFQGSRYSNNPILCPYGKNAVINDPVTTGKLWEAGLLEVQFNKQSDGSVLASLINKSDCHLDRVMSGLAVRAYALRYPAGHSEHFTNQTQVFHFGPYGVGPGDKATVIVPAYTENGKVCSMQVDIGLEDRNNKPMSDLGGHVGSDSEICPYVIVTPTPTPTVTPTPTPTPTTVVKSKGISVSKTDNRDITRPGHTATYEITVKNTGEVDLKDIKVIDYVPSYLTVTSIEGGGSKDGSLVIWEGLSLDPNQSGTLRFNVKVNSDAPNGYVLNNRVVAESKDRDLRDEARDTTIVERPAKVAGTVITPTPVIVPVPVTAKTGAGFTAIASTLLGGSGLAFVIRRRGF